MSMHCFPSLSNRKNFKRIIICVYRKYSPITNYTFLLFFFVSRYHPGRAVKFKGKNIHVLNKCETCIKGTKFAADVASRHNVILMGDSLGDVDMSRGVKCDDIIRIGFLNDNIQVLITPGI